MLQSPVRGKVLPVLMHFSQRSRDVAYTTQNRGFQNFFLEIQYCPIRAFHVTVFEQQTSEMNSQESIMVDGVQVWSYET